MENCGNRCGPQVNTGEALTACSACAGDYEDPDRAAWTADENRNDDDEESRGELSGEIDEASE